MLVGLGLFHGFSKMLIALGLEPDQMDTTVLPTPAAPEETLSLELDTDDPHIARLAARPDLAVRWQDMATQLVEGADEAADAIEAARGRLATMFGADWAPPSDANNTDSVALAEAFVLDVRSIDTAQFAQPERIRLLMALAVYDGMYRTAPALAAS